MTLRGRSLGTVCRQSLRTLLKTVIGPLGHDTQHPVGRVTPKIAPADIYPNIRYVQGCAAVNPGISDEKGCEIRLTYTVI